MLDVLNFEGRYLVTDDGKVWSNLRNKFLKPGLDKDGYEIVCLHKNGVAYWFRLHRLIAKTFIPNPDGKPEINHIDGNKRNNSIDNLEWVTSSENKYHAFKHNLKEKTVGEKHGMHVLSNKQVQMIRFIYGLGGVSQSTIGKIYGVRQEQICRIVNYKSWKEEA